MKTKYSRVFCGTLCTNMQSKNISGWRKWICLRVLEIQWNMCTVMLHVRDPCHKARTKCSNNIIFILFLVCLCVPKWICTTLWDELQEIWDEWQRSEKNFSSSSFFHLIIMQQGGLLGTLKFYILDHSSCNKSNLSQRSTDFLWQPFPQN